MNSIFVKKAGPGPGPAFLFLITILAVLLFVISGCSPDHGRDTAIYKEGEVLVRFKSGTGLQKRKRLHKAIGSMATSYHLSLIDFDRVRLPAGMKVEDAVKIYMDNPEVEFAEPNYIVRKAMIPDDTYFNLQWGFYNFGQEIIVNEYRYTGRDDADIDMTDAWDIFNGLSGAEGAVIAVIDTGVDYTHADIKDNIWKNPGEIADNGIDDDGNGKIDDIIGWNFAANNNDPMDDDIDGHGTHVAGIIGAVGNNGTGIAGIDWLARIMPLKFLDSDGNGTIADAVDAIDYATLMGAKIINASYTYPHKCIKTNPYNSKIERDAISEAGMRGVLFVAAAGNYHCNNDNTPLYPAGHNLSNIISVAATNADDELASWSNYGINSVHVAAPGEDIYSTVPVAKGGYAYMSGTSSASPFVSGLAGLVSSIHPEYGYAEIKEAILASVDVLESLEGNLITGGKINAYKTLTYSGEPAVPSAVMLKVVSSSQIDISWTDNSYNEDGFIIERKTGETGDYIPVTPDGVNADFYSDTGLADGTLYYYRVRAYNKNGYSLYSSGEKAITTLNPPSLLSLSATSDPGINISWADNSVSEDGFVIERREGDEGNYDEISTVNSNITSYYDGNVRAAAVYYYRVRAVNSIAGYSAYSDEADITTHEESNPESAGNNESGMDTPADSSVKKASKDPRCFIATAAYGSPLHPRVQILRNFRDRYLLSNSVGQKFVDLYYRISPPVAGLISRHEYLREGTRLLLTPLITIIEIIVG